MDQLKAQNCQSFRKCSFAQAPDYLRMATREEDRLPSRQELEGALVAQLDCQKTSGKSLGKRLQMDLHSGFLAGVLARQWQEATYWRKDQLKSAV